MPVGGGTIVKSEELFERPTDGLASVHEFLPLREAGDQRPCGCLDVDFGW